MSAHLFATGINDHRSYVSFWPRYSAPSTTTSLPNPTTSTIVGGSGCPIGTTGSVPVALYPASVSGGVEIFTGSTPGLGAGKCTNRATSFELYGSSIAVAFAPQGDQTKCATSTVILGPNITPGAKTTSTSGDMATIFGSVDPELPLAFVACPFGGTSPPAGITVYVKYTTTAK